MKNICTIAETAWHHDGDFQFLMNLVDELINRTNTTFIKFHVTLNLNEYMDSNHLSFDYLNSRLLKAEQWEMLFEKVKASDKKLMLLFNDTEAVNLGLMFNPDLIEVHSVCLNDFHLLSSIRKGNKNNIPIVFGVGGSTLYEIEQAISFIESENIVLMHGFQNYPTDYREINFNRIRKIMNLYPSYKHGYADHTAWNDPQNTLVTIMGAALGMDYIEKHVTTEIGTERTDWQAAISIDQFNELNSYLDVLNHCNGNGLLKFTDGEKNYSVFGPNKKAAVFSMDFEKGERLKMDNIRFLRISQRAVESQIEVLELLGKKAVDNYFKGELISKTKFE